MTGEVVTLHSAAPTSPRRARLRLHVVDLGKRRPKNLGKVKVIGAQRAVLPLEIEDYIPSPLRLQVKRREIEIVPTVANSRWRALSAQGRLFWLLLGIRLGQIFGWEDEEANAIRTRELLESLGGIWVKIGQVLSLRTDMLKPAMCRELSKLQYRVSGFSWAQARAVLEEELGPDAIKRLFTTFETHPFAAASICQVHKATLRKGNKSVVVKIQRPDASIQFREDVRLVDRVVGLMELLGIGRMLMLREGLREINEILQEETDYRYEAANIRRMRKSLREHDVHVPRVFSKISTRRVLVMEYVPGVLMSELVEVERENPRRVEEWLNENDIDRRKVAESMVITMFRQVLEDNLFHGDLHPGNIILLRENKFSLIDFGSIGSLEPDTLRLYKEVNRALMLKDFRRAADYMLCMAPALPTARAGELRQSLTHTMKGWEARSHLRGLPYAERGMGSISTESSRVMGRFRTPPSWAMLRMGRTLGTLDASLQTLVPEANFLKLYAAYHRDLQRRRRDPRKLARDLGRSVGEVMSIASDARILLSSDLRREALKVKGMMGSFSRVWAVVLSRLRWVAIGFCIFSLIAWFCQFDRHLLPARLVPLARWIDDATPDAAYMVWMSFAILALFAAHIFRAASSTLRQPE